MSHVIGRGRYARETYPSPKTGDGGFDPTPFLNQTAWFVDYDTGDNTNNGLTAETAVAQAAEVRRRWDGGLLGVTPTLPAIDIIVTVTGNAPDFTDPICALFDLEMQPGGSLVIDFTTSVAHAGTIASVPNAFARTSTGQQTVTDAGVATWNPYVDQLLIDTTAGAATWVVKGGTPGTLAAARAASTNASTYAIATAEGGLATAAVVATDAYDVLSLPQVYFGTRADFRLASGSGNPSGSASVLVRRAHGLAQATTDVLTVNGDISFDIFSGALVMFTECIMDQGRQTQRGGVVFANCSATSGPPLDSISGGPGTTCGLLAGYARRNVALGGNGTFADQDFQILGSFYLLLAEPTAVAPGSVTIGNFGRFLDGGAANPAGYAFGSDMQIFGSLYDGSNTCYGTTSGAAIFKMAAVETGDAPGGFLAIIGTASANFAFDGGTAAFFQAANQEEAFSQNLTTGAWVGPTTMTLAHLDAALAAGTGLGGSAYWFPSDSRIIVRPA